MSSPTTAPAQTPEACIANHASASGAANPADQAIITRVETAISHSPMGWLQGLLGESSSKADADRAQAEEKCEEMEEEVRNNQANAPEGEGPAPTRAPAVRPQVTPPQSSSTGGQATGPGGRQGAQQGAQHAKAGLGEVHAGGSSHGSVAPATLLPEHPY